METRTHYDLFGVRLRLTTNSDRIAEEARLFLGDHEVAAGSAPAYELVFEESPSMPDYGLPELKASQDHEHSVVERDARVYMSVGEGVACLDHEARTCRGHVHPRRNGQWHPSGSVPLLHPLILRIMFAQGFLPLHAGAVVFRGRLVVLMGEKGAGKSTLAVTLHREGCPLVCDDMLYLARGKSGLEGGGHCQPLKLKVAEAAQLPDDCRYETGAAQVAGKALFSVRKLAPDTVNRLYPVGAFIYLLRSVPAEKPVVWSDRPTEITYHMLGDSPLASLPAYHARALEWLCAPAPASTHLVQTAADAHRTCHAILRALN